jgi:hypothetical protein
MTKDDIIRMAQEAQLVRFEGGENEAYQLGQASPDDHSRAYWSIATPEKLARFAASIYMKGYDAGTKDGLEGCAYLLERLHERQGPEPIHNYYLFAAEAIKAGGHS